MRPSSSGGRDERGRRRNRRRGRHQAQPGAPTPATGLGARHRPGRQHPARPPPGGGAVADWLDAAGLEFGRPPAEAGAVLVLERPGRTRPEIGRLAGHAAGFEPDPLDPAAGEGLARAIDAACADAGLSPREIAVIVSGAPPQLAALEDRALAAMPGGRRLSPKTVFGETLGAAGPL